MQGYDGSVTSQGSQMTCGVVEGSLQEQKGPLGRPTIRWEDDLRKLFGATWRRMARARGEWSKF